MSTEELSPKMREYLAEIYRLGDHTSEYVSTSTLAEMLDVSAPAVNRMVSKLKELGLLEHEPYQGIRLEAAGTREALKELRRHRIAESFLVNVMGFGWHEVHDEANRISSAMSSTLTNRMAEMAGSPIFCPHGEPIPAENGEILDLEDHYLADVQPEDGPFTITRIRIRESDRLEYLEALELLPGTQLDLIHIAPFQGPLQLKLKDQYRIIGYNLAQVIKVKPASAG